MQRHQAVEGTQAYLLPTLTRWAIMFADAVGAEVMREVVGFVERAEPGAMVTIRCTRDGFTAQVTGPIVGGNRRPAGADKERAEPKRA